VLIKVAPQKKHLTVDAEFKQLLDESKKVNMSRSSSRAKITDHRHRKTEQEEDAELLQDEEDEEDERTIFRESPACKPILKQS
jgi:SWI/SNF-related matrix-associated actin-dependent regulator of chromatin subfamily A member 5